MNTPTKSAVQCPKCASTDIKLAPKTNTMWQLVCKDCGLHFWPKIKELNKAVLEQLGICTQCWGTKTTGGPEGAGDYMAPPIEKCSACNGTGRTPKK